MLYLATHTDITSALFSSALASNNICSHLFCACNKWSPLLPCEVLAEKEESAVLIGIVKRSNIFAPLAQLKANADMKYVLGRARKHVLLGNLVV